MFRLDPEITTSTTTRPDITQASAVVDALLRFGLAQDRRYDAGARELFESAFTEDAVLDFRAAAAKCGIEVPLMTGRDMITSIIMDPGTHIDTTHVVTNTRVQIDDGIASFTALVEAQHLPTGDHSRHALLKNMYAVHARRDDKLWRMSEVSIDCVWFTGDPTVITGRP
ncbi:MAG: nuclear transport factor 2 family protein [Streptosporangiales bacterium]|nr:nuclear transport factor 2 family protein [Streptosporangiales bacterium]